MPWKGEWLACCCSPYTTDLHWALNRFRAKATETFRDIFSFHRVVGASIASLPTLQCLFHWNFYSKFVVVVVFPLLVAAVTILIAWIGICCRRKYCPPRIAKRMTLSPRIYLGKTRKAAAEAAGPVSSQRELPLHKQCWNYIRSKSFMAPAVFMFLLFCE